MKYFILPLLFLLSGCATYDKVLDAFFMKYDSNEYRLISEIRSNAKIFKDECTIIENSKINAQTISNQSTNFVYLTQYLPRNRVVNQAAIELDKIIQGLNDQYKKNGKVSATFCKIKYESIEKNAELMQKKIGDKPR